jgi:hypothetical protein
MGIFKSLVNTYGMNGQMDGWMDGWLHGLVDGTIWISTSIGVPLMFASCIGSYCKQWTGMAIGTLCHIK